MAESSNKKVSKPVGVALLILFAIIILGFATTKILWELFPDTVSLEIKKAGITATIIGGSGLFLITTYIYFDMFTKILKAITPVFIIGAVSLYFIPKSFLSSVTSEIGIIATPPLKDFNSLQSLVEMLDNPTLKKEAYLELQDLTGQNFGYDKEAWQNWLNDKSKSIKTD